MNTAATHPYDKNDTNAAIDYGKRQKALFRSGMIDEAYAMYMRDPNGGADPYFSGTTKDDYVLGMQSMSGGSDAALRLSPAERQAWCESNVSDDMIDRIALAGGYQRICGDRHKFLEFKDVIDSAMKSRTNNITAILTSQDWSADVEGHLQKKNENLCCDVDPNGQMDGGRAALVLAMGSNEDFVDMERVFIPFRMIESAVDLVEKIHTEIGNFSRSLPVSSSPVSSSPAPSSRMRG